MHPWILLLSLMLCVGLGCRPKPLETKAWHQDPVLVDRVLRLALEAGHMSEGSLSAFTVSVWVSGPDSLVEVTRDFPDGRNVKLVFRYEPGKGLQSSGESLQSSPDSNRAQLAGRAFERVYSATGFKTQRNPLVPMP